MRYVLESGEEHAQVHDCLLATHLRGDKFHKAHLCLRLRCESDFFISLCYLVRIDQDKKPIALQSFKGNSVLFLPVELVALPPISIQPLLSICRLD